MIARVWRGVIRAQDAESYIDYIQATGGGEYTLTPGNRGAWIMSRIDGDRAEIIALSFWDSRHTIERFAGPDIERQVLYPEDERYLLVPSTVSHYEIATPGELAGDRDDLGSRPAPSPGAGVLPGQAAGGERGADGRLRRARQLYEQAVFSGTADPLAEADRELDLVEADLAVARARLAHTRFLLRRDDDPAGATEDPSELALCDRAANLYRAYDDVRGEAEALFWTGCYHQVIRRDNSAAAPLLQRSLELATQVGDTVTMSEALRHLGIEAHAAGRLDVARRRLEESTRLRREIGLPPGVAANLIGLAYIAAAQERLEDALALLDEAEAIAEANNAQRILRQVNQARAELPGQHG
jgi:tetratricopeptide (TPR) repeat protein